MHVGPVSAQKNLSVLSLPPTTYYLHHSTAPTHKFEKKSNSQFMLELMTHYREGRSSSTRSRPDAPLASNKNSLTGATFTSSQRVLTGKDRDFIRSSLEGPGPKNCAVAVEKLRNALEGFSGACREKGYLGEVRPMKVMMEQQNKNRTIR